MAKAALLVDNDCQCANLVIAAAAGNNNGTRTEKLKDVNVKQLSDVEKAWYSLLSTPNDKFNESAEKALKNHPNSPLISWLNSGQDTEANKAFANKFPALAAGAYNTIAYAFAREGDYDLSLIHI